MAKLPTAESLGQRSYRDTSIIVRPSFDNSGQRQLAANLQQASRNMNDRLDQSSLNKAKIHFQKLKLEADNAFNEDADFETFGTRYDEMITKAAEESASMVRNPRMKQAFQDELSLYRAQGNQAIKKLAFEKETEQGLANLSDVLTTGRENYLRATTPEDRAFARETMMEAIDWAEEDTYIDATRAQQLRQKTAVDMAIASVEIETPEKQVKLLSENKGLIDVIPKDVRLKMLESAQGQSINNQALAVADAIRNSGGELPERLKAVREIKDADVRTAVQRQVEHDYRLEKTARLESYADNYNEARKALNGGVSVDQWRQQNPSAWDNMSGDQQASLISSQSQPRQHTDRQAYINVLNVANSDRAKAYDMLLENHHKFTDSDFKSLAKTLNDPVETDGFISRSRRLENALNEIGVDDKKGERYRLAESQLDKDVQLFEEKNGRQPDSQELDNLISKITEHVSGGWFKKERYGFDLSASERSERLSPEDQKKTDNFNQLLVIYENGLLQEDGIPVVISDEEKAFLYQAWDSQGLLDGEL